jgi:hypothetical protein
MISACLGFLFSCRILLTHTIKIICILKAYMEAIKTLQHVYCVQTMRLVPPYTKAFMLGNNSSWSSSNWPAERGITMCHYIVIKILNMFYH